MDKKPLVGVSICAVVLLIIGSMSNIVGYQTAQASNQKIINSDVDQKELLFQTIVDTANNREIQKVILGSEMTGKRFFNPGLKFSVFNPHVLTKRFLDFTYHFGLILSKTISKSKMHSILERYQVNNQVVQKELSSVIKKDTTLRSEMTQLSNLMCDCENDNTTRWGFPILCTLLMPFVWLSAILYFINHNLQFISIMLLIGQILNCYWVH